MPTLEDEALQLTERVAELARELGIETALIGAAALAIHNYVRASEDIDLASHTELSKLRELQQRLESMQLQTELRTPDEEDPLGGVLEVWQRTDEEGDPIDSIEIVNFANPWRPGQQTPARDVLANAKPVAPDSPLRCAQLPDLIALKLYAGSARDKADIIDLLVRNPDADLGLIRAVCKRYGYEQALEDLIAAARVE